MAFIQLRSVKSWNLGPTLFNFAMSSQSLLSMQPFGNNHGGIFWIPLSWDATMQGAWKIPPLVPLVVASGRTRRLVISCVFCIKWVRWEVGGMLTFIGLAHLRDATLLHVLFNLHSYVMLRYCTFSSIYTTTWCYVDWGGGMGGWAGGMLTFIGIGGITKTKSFAACSLTSTVPSCLKSLARSKSTYNGWVWRNLFFPIFTEKWRLWWGQRWIHLCDVVVSNMCGDVISKLVHHWSCWKSWQSWWKTR